MSSHIFKSNFQHNDNKSVLRNYTEIVDLFCVYLEFLLLLLDIKPTTYCIDACVSVGFFLHLLLLITY